MCASLKVVVRSALIALLAITLVYCAPPNPRQVQILSGSIMGTYYRVTVVSNEPLNRQQVELQLLEEMQMVDKRMSSYKKDSELSHINGAAAGETITISAPMQEVLLEAERVAMLSEGYFDITVSPLVSLWGFGAARGADSRPTSDQIAHVLAVVGSDSYEIGPKSITKLHAETQFDLSAIAKGYAVDRVAERLSELGFNDYLVDIGGELRAAGGNINSKPWTVGIEKPIAMGGLYAVTELSDSSIATSGDYRNQIELDGKWYSHTINPHTGQATIDELASVSVFHQSTMTADAYATAILAMGKLKGMQFANEHAIESVFIFRNPNDGNLRLTTSRAFSKARVLNWP